MAWLAKSISGWGQKPKTTVTPVHSAMDNVVSTGTGTASGSSSSPSGSSSASKMCSLMVATVLAATSGPAQLGVVVRGVRGVGSTVPDTGAPGSASGSPSPPPAYMRTAIRR